jgi:hypothetical protein
MRARKIVRGLKEGLTEAERYAVADQVVSQLKQHGDPWELSEEAKPTRGPTTINAPAQVIRPITSRHKSGKSSYIHPH